MIAEIYRARPLVFLGFVLLSFLAATNRTTAQPVGPPQNPPASSSHRTSPIVELTGAERLTIRFRGYQELTGDYRVGADNTISIPVIGRVSIAGVGAAELEKALAAKVTEIAGKDGYVTVEIATYRPVFVTGYVKNPGAAQWQPGLTVLQAVSLSGGTGAAGGLQPDDDLIRVRKAVDDQKRILAVLARLRAEQAGSASVDVPSRLVTLVGKPEAEDLIERQKALLVSRRSSLESQFAALERGRTLANQELENLQAQAAKLGEQLRARQDYRAKLQDLQTKGIVSAVRGLEEDLRVSDLEEKITNISVGIARVQSTLTSMQRDGVLLKLDREADIDAEIARLERDSAQLDIEIGSASVAPENIRNGIAQANGRLRQFSYQIIRQGTEGSAPITASQSSLLKPGDVVVVSQ